MKFQSLTSLLAAVVFVSAPPPAAAASHQPKTLLTLKPGDNNPRNSEGDFIRLANGQWMFVYTHFSGGSSDHAAAYLAARISNDGGRTWSQDEQVVVPNEGGMNVMSVSLLRLRSNRIALFYLRKHSLEDCRPVMRVSEDEGKTWSEPIQIIREPVGYYVMNNDRVIQTSTGRLIAPVALHNLPGYEKPDWTGKITTYHSDDEGRTWQRSKSLLVGKRPDGSREIVQEPGVVELRDGRLMMWMRTNGGSQFVCYSTDHGGHWTEPRPGNLISPRSPASIERIPATGDLVAVWNDHSDIPDELRNKRTPFTAALSRDEGQTWEPPVVIADHPDGWYCYTAIDFAGESILLGHCAGLRSQGGLNTSKITALPITSLYRTGR